MTVATLCYGSRGLQYIDLTAVTQNFLLRRWHKKKFAAVSKPPMISGKVKITGTVTVPGTPIIKIIVIATIVSSDDDDRQ